MSFASYRFFWICGVLFALCSAGLAAPAQINYQARLSDALGGLITTTCTLEFRFWNSEQGGAQLGGSYSDVRQVKPDSQGVVSATVGQDPGNPIPAAVFDLDNVWLEARVNGQPVSPRQRLSSVPYALRASYAQNVGAHSHTDAEVSDNLTVSSLGSVSGAAIKSGTVGEPFIASSLTRDTELQTALATKANLSEVFTKSESDERYVARSAEAYLVVKTTASPQTNGTNLLAAYTQVKALTPHGQPLSASNRAMLIVPPGKYDLGTGQLVLNTEFVDVAGLTSVRANQHIYGTANGVNSGVLRQTANNVKIENLLVECTQTAVTYTINPSCPAAYFPDSNKPATIVRNCEFLADDTHALSMRAGTTYSGTYTDCKAGIGAFGGYDGGVASGVFTNCTGANISFGAMNATASGKFVNCTGGEYAFGGWISLASGTFINCTGGSESFGGSQSTVTGTFTNCTGGFRSFGGDGSTITGTFSYCIGHTYSFGGWNGQYVGARFCYCQGLSSSFGGTGTASFLYCLLNGAVYP